VDCNLSIIVRLSWDCRKIFCISKGSVNETVVLSLELHTHTHTHTDPFNGPFSRTTRVSRYQKGKTNLDFTVHQETVSGISWAICKSAPRSRQITVPAPHHSVFYRPDALPAAQPTASKHWRPVCTSDNKSIYLDSWHVISKSKKVRTTKVKIARKHEVIVSKIHQFIQRTDRRPLNIRKSVTMTFNGII